MSDDTASAPNGQAPAMEVDPEAVIARLSAQVGQMAQQLAMRDAYIDRLHQALAAVAAPSEQPVPAAQRRVRDNPQA